MRNFLKTNGMIIFSMIIIFSLIALPGIFTGCASIMSGASQSINITSSPDNARIVIYDTKNNVVSNSTTPVLVKLKRGAGFFRGASYRVEINRDGYEMQTIEITSHLNGGWYIAGNLLFGGFLGWLIVDPATGAMWRLMPNNIELTQGISYDKYENVDGIYIVLKDQIPEAVFENLELIKIN